MKDSDNSRVDRMNGRSRQWWRWPLIVLALIIFIIVGLRLSLKSGFVHRWVRNTIVQSAGGSINGQLELEAVKGDLWKEIRLIDIRIVNSEGDTVFSADTLTADYDLLSYFQSEFQIDRIALADPFLKLVQDAGGNWNLQQLVEESPDTATTTGSAFALNVGSFSLRQGTIEGRIHALRPDSVLTVQNLNIEGAFSYGGPNYTLQLSDIGFQVSNTRLESPVTVQSALQATEQQVTLENLVVATGASLLRSSATIDMADSTMSVKFSANPLSWRDLSAYLDQYPTEKNLQIELSLKGNLTEFDLMLETEAEGLQGLSLNTGFRWDGNLVLQHAEMRAERMDLQSFFSNPSYPQLEEVYFSAGGRFNFSEMEQSRLDGKFSGRKIIQNEYSIDRIEGDFSLREGDLTTNANIARSGESVSARVMTSGIWREVPKVTATMRGRNIDPSYWAQNPGYSGSVNFTARVTGEGFQLSEREWQYELDLADSRIAGQPLSVASFKGSINSNRITAESRIQLKQSRLQFQAQVNNYTNNPEYRYDLNIHALNLAECRGFENFTTAINGTIQGEGKYISPEQLELTSKIRIDSSIVNDELIEHLNAEIVVQDTVVNIKSGDLSSAIADGSFDARIHLTDLYDIGNRVDLDFNIKDLQSFAPLLDVETLRAQGSVTGTLNPVNKSQLQFQGAVDFNSVLYNELLTADRIQGDVEVLLTEEPEYVLNLSLDEPVINSVVLQDVNSTVHGKAAPDSTYGTYELTFSSPDGSRIQQAGRYNFGSETINILTSELQIISSLRKLTLVKPFTAEISGQSFSLDTLQLVSNDGALLEMAITYADSLTQRGFLRGQNLNLTVIQNTLLNEAYFEGILSGTVSIDRRDTMITSSGDLKIDSLAYRGSRVDSLTLNYRLQDDRLDGMLNLYDGSNRLAEGGLSLPFKMGDPNTFPSSFFEEEVSGHLNVRKVALSRFEDLLGSIGLTNSEGAFQFNGSLRGVAGEPEFDASVRLTNTRLSGVALDSVTAAIDYNHNGRRLDVNASIMSLKQRAAEVDARLPLHVDLKNFDVAWPNNDDSIHVDIHTNRFNLASLNDFVDRSRFREIRGRLDGNVAVSGQIDDLKTEGKLSFRDGAIRIVAAGIKVDNIQSDFSFDKNRVQVSQFRARSGAGTFRVEGSINMEQLQPGQINISMKADNFRVANTSNYNVIVDLNTKVSGTASSPNVKGDLSVVSGYFYLQNFGEKTVEAVELDTAAAEDSYFARYDSLSLDMDLSFNRRFYIRNRRFLDLEYELEGQLDLLKHVGEDLSLFGSVSAVEGYARPLAKRFELEEGVITFTGDPTNPQLNVRHLFTPPQQQELGDVKIWYIIEGTVENPKFRYDSEPPMGLEDIISYTLFGQPFMSLDPWKQIVASSGNNPSATNVAMDVLLDKVETLATQRLGIDVVQIDNTRRGTDTGTTIKTGWYLNPKVFFAIQNVIAGSAPETIFQLEYLLKKNLRLILIQDSDSQTGLDIKWYYDY